MAFAQLTYRESLRDIEACLRAKPEQTVPHGDSQSQCPQYARRCKRSPRLAHLSRDFAQRSDRVSQGALTRRRASVSSWMNTRLCAGRHHHRFVPLPVPVGATFATQGSHQTAHPAGSAWRAFPPFIHISDGKLHESRLSTCRFSKRVPSTSWIVAISISDASTLSTHSLAFFVVRAKSNLQCQRVYSHPVDKARACYAINYRRSPGLLSSQHYPDKLRRVRYRRCQNHQNPGASLTNNFSLASPDHCQLYRCRWQVELFFKWIKQNLRIKTFLRHHATMP